MSLLELLNPDFLKELLETMGTLANALQYISRAGFDDASRLRVRAEYLDDGHVRIWDSSKTVDLLEVLKEFSWTFYSLAESNKYLSDITGTPDSEPPSGGVVLLGYDGAYLRRVRVTSDGKLLAVLG